MKFNIKNGTPEKQRSACVVAGIFEQQKLTPAAEALDKSANGYITGILGRGDMKGKAGSTLMLHNVPNSACERVLLVGLGKEQELGDKGYRDAVRAVFKALSDTGAADAILFLLEAPVKNRDLSWKVLQIAIGGLESMYRFDRLKSKVEEAEPKLQKITLGIIKSLTEEEQAASEEALQQGLAVADGMSLAKDLGNLAPNICTPTYLAEQAMSMAKTYKLKVTVLEQKDMEDLGMGALLAVARGSRQPPKLIALEYWGGAKKGKPVVLVGKGVTFDTGGISLKPAPEMDEMKYDMCGAASVLGTIDAVAKMGLPVNVVGIIPATENMPGGNATKPGDVVTSMSGQTIEILNTDAEGRLILCDALAYAERYEPESVINIATLTGACVIALGHVASGLLGNDDELAQELLDASERAVDRAWRLPLFDEYQEQLKSNFADMANIGGRAAGTITAACFLSRFTKKYRWAHLDVAGTAWKSGKEKGATGRPVPLLTQFLISRTTKQSGNTGETGSRKSRRKSKE
ncbi:aminopeptidase A. Metallo peptidase. MEROPS family M17 [Nitrosospira multiformis]|uniref:Probable cytosol aminopeptidase n=1 Tax=Nitrosospira multiformis TaxID=1231 RepID=A0A1I0EDJ6_9PROT|nr:leucyl aminopeptidase [Nitrosospira multiformis]SET43297.1 aminopeptidase A. Metallo peptidase. MEROPS family M17 [Nitrosospira multiformis]